MTSWPASANLGGGGHGGGGGHKVLRDEKDAAKIEDFLLSLPSSAFMSTLMLDSEKKQKQQVCTLGLKKVSRGDALCVHGKQCCCATCRQKK